MKKNNPFRIVTHIDGKRLDKKYKIEFIQTETFVIDVYAKNAEKAILKAEKEWERGAYQEIGDLNVRIDAIYDVTDTNDPFNP